MYELYPYFTNDGTVGLFSREDDDIYHSTYGALSESWQKFTLPSHLEEYLKFNNEVKILDICYGIGYNTKTALQVFINNYFEKEKLAKKNNKNSSLTSTSSSAIHSDNIVNYLSEEISKNEVENLFDSEKISDLNICNDGAIHSNNISLGNEQNNCSEITSNIKNKSSILIDAIDMDRNLVYLSPFIVRLKRKRLWNNNSNLSFDDELQEKLQQINKMRNFSFKFPPKELRLKKEISLILIKKLFEQNLDFYKNSILQTILNHKKYRPFISRFMTNFANFYQNNRYKNTKTENKSPFLHNIYYEHLSRSNKRVENLLKNARIDVKFHIEDARKFILKTNSKYNFIFLDAFTPAKRPTLWTLQFFKELYEKLEDDGMILTYSNSAAVRNAFVKNNFYIGKIYDPKLNKYVGTVATKNKKLIEHELNECDLALINSKAGICFRDEYLSLDESTIIENRENEVKQSELISSSRAIKEHKNA